MFIGLGPVKVNRTPLGVTCHCAAVWSEDAEQMISSTDLNDMALLKECASR
jgi:hypothetical protein